MKVAVLVEDQYQVLEVWYPYLRLREEGVETVLAGTGAGKVYASKEGYPAEEEVSARDLDPAGFAGVVVPGGWAPDMLRRSSEITGFVREVFDGGHLVAGICHAGWLLASAGVLKGRRATCFHAIRDDVVNAGAKYEDSSVVVDGNLITSRNPYDLPDFCREIIRFLRNR